MKQVVVSELFRCMPAGLLARCAGNGLLIPYYHMISDLEVSHLKNLYTYKNKREFTEDLDFLLKHFRPVGLAEVMALSRKAAGLTGPSFLLTFDDGFREMAEVVAPILMRKGVPAVFFLGSGFIDNQSLCYDHKKSLIVESLKIGVSLAKGMEIKRLAGSGGEQWKTPIDAVMAVDYNHAAVLDRVAEVLHLDFQDYLKRGSPYLNAEDVRALIRQGFAIGGHSIDHPMYSHIPLEEQLRQTEVSVREVRNGFGLNYGAFAFPHGDEGVSPAFFRRIREGGLVDIFFGTGGLMSGSFDGKLQRVSFEKPHLKGALLFRLAAAKRMYRGFRAKRR